MLQNQNKEIFHNRFWLDYDNHHIKLSMFI